MQAATQIKQSKLAICVLLFVLIFTISFSVIIKIMFLKLLASIVGKIIILGSISRIKFGL